MNRRGFLAGILASAAAPAFVRFGSLMVLKAPVGGSVLTLADFAQISQEVVLTDASLERFMRAVTEEMAKNIRHTNALLRGGGLRYSGFEISL